MKDVVRFGCWAAFWGDTQLALRQLLSVPKLDYLVSDYLAEITMALLARARAKDPSAGFVPDVVTSLAPVLKQVHDRGIKVITNGGGLNPLGCAAALEEAAAAAGVALKVAAVCGDDLSADIAEIVSHAPKDMFTGEAIPAELNSLNVYLGARAIATALDAGADIVVTGRCVDAAVVLGPLLHEFGWNDDDYDLLSAGTLVGHIIECGPQCTGGTHTDWWAVPGWDNIGYPVAEVHRDGTAFISKPEGTGGLVAPATVAEQILYEIGDPGAYLMPDVVCDWRHVKLSLTADDRVHVSGARGSGPTNSFKATATMADGFRVMATAMFAGIDAAARARRLGHALVERLSRVLVADGSAAIEESSIEVIGAGDLHGAEARLDCATEVVLKIGLRHREEAPLKFFSREFAAMSLVAQGMTGLFAGRPRVSPVLRVLHLLIDKALPAVAVHLGGKVIAVETSPGSSTARLATPELADSEGAQPISGITVPLRRIAYGRSGDKGNKANIGLIARRPEFLPVLCEQVTTQRVASFFRHYRDSEAEVRRWDLPGLNALNFVLDEVLGGCGGTSSLRYDPQGKSYAAMLLALPVTVPAAWDMDGLLAEGRS